MLILAVDDDVDDLELFKDAVTKIGEAVDVITAANGVEAINFLKDQVVVFPDFIFLDINMPKMDGRECVALLKADPALRHIPVIMYSTSFSNTDMQTFDRLQCSYLNKASSCEQLTKSLTEVFSKLRTQLEMPSSFYRQPRIHAENKSAAIK